MTTSSMHYTGRSNVATEVTEWDSAEASARSTKAAKVRAVSGKRRRVDPTTCDRDYSGAELEFMGAMQVYKNRSGNRFPDWSAVLEVLTGLGYIKGDESTTVAFRRRLAGVTLQAHVDQTQF